MMDMTSTPLDDRLRELFGDQVVEKEVARDSTFARLPKYVSEYLIAKYVRRESFEADLENVRVKLSKLVPDVDRGEVLRDELLRNREVVLIDVVEAKVDLKSGKRFARVPAIKEDSIRISAKLTEDHPGLLSGGLWGTVKLSYSATPPSKYPIHVESFSPFQIGSPALDEYIQGRGMLSADEWLALLLRSAGYEPDAFPTRRQKLLLLCRLIPLVERNVNLIELGPRQTGKTYLLRNLSPRVYTVSGGKATPANLFVNLATKELGILGTRKVVVFDEIAHTSFGARDETISTLKDYMESGTFGRGSKSFTSDACLFFAGNLDVEGDAPHSRYDHLFEALPEALIDSAFIDRIHGYIPGWELPKLTPGSFARGVGFVTDYFGEILIRLRQEDFHHHLMGVRFAKGITRRDQVAVTRISSGLLKLLYPNGEFDSDDLGEILSIATELRQLVHDQLVAIAPGEFSNRSISAEPPLDPLLIAEQERRALAIPLETRGILESYLGTLIDAGLPVEFMVYIPEEEVEVAAPDAQPSGEQPPEEQPEGVHDETIPVVVVFSEIEHQGKLDTMWFKTADVDSRLKPMGITMDWWTDGERDEPFLVDARTKGVRVYPKG